MTEERGQSAEVAQLAELASRFVDRGMFDEAGELYRLVLRLDPDRLSAKQGLARARGLSRHDRPRRRRSDEEIAREQSRRNTIDAAHFLGLAHLFAEKGEHDRAAECLDIAKAKDPGGPAPHKLLGRVLSRRKDYPGAARELRQAQRFNPFDREVAEQLSRVELERRRYRSALEAAIDALLLLPEGDTEREERVKRRIRTLKELLGWDHDRTLAVFHERQETLRTAFDRLEWHRTRFLEHGSLPEAELFAPRLARPVISSGRLALAARLRRQEIWAHLTDEQLFELSRVAQEETYDRGSILFEHADEGRDLYLLEEGEVTVRRPTSYGTFLLATLSPGSLFGEVTFIERGRRSGEVAAASATRVIRIDALGLDELIDGSPELGVQIYWTLWHELAGKLRRTNEQLKGFFEEPAEPENFLRLRRGEQAQIAGRVEVDAGDKIRLFREQGLSSREMATLATFSRERRYVADASIFHEGESGAEMFVVLQGRVRISKYIPGGGDEALAILGRGDFFGEMSLIDGQPRSADARAHGGEVTVLALDRETIRDVLSLDPQASLEFLALLCRLIARRLREIDEKVVGWRILAGQRSRSESA